MKAGFEVTEASEAATALRKIEDEVLMTLIEAYEEEHRAIPDASPVKSFAR